MSRYSARIALLAALIPPLFIASLGLGPTTLSLHGFESSIASLFGSGELHYIVTDLRLPRTAMAALTGFCLGLAGAVLQVVTRNPLASPYTFGVSAAASFGAALAIVMGAAVTGWLGRVEFYTNPLLLVANSIAFSIASCTAIVALTVLRGFSPGATVLFGISMTFLFTAATSLIECFGTSEQVAAVVFWMFGDLSRASTLSIVATLATLIPLASIATIAGSRFTALLLGDEIAASLGIDVRKLRALGIATASTLVAVPTSMVGAIGFLGLIAPHIARKLVGDECRRLFPASGLAGAALLIAADTASRTIATPIAIPVGVLTSFLGVPLLLYVAATRRSVGV